MESYTAPDECVSNSLSTVQSAFVTESIMLLVNTVPQGDLVLPLHKNRLLLIIKALEDRLSSELRKMWRDIIVQTDQALLHSLQSGDGSDELRLRGKQEDGIFSDWFGTLLDGCRAHGMFVGEASCTTD